MRMTPAYPTNDRCLDVPTASQALADHGRNCHRLADQWRLECKKAKELGQKPPLPPQARKRQEAAEAKKKASALAGGPPASTKEAEAERAETDSSEDERNAADNADVADAPGDAPPQEAAPEHNPSRPSFLAV